jgi:hypothetical protein
LDRYEENGQDKGLQHGRRSSVYGS